MITVVNKRTHTPTADDLYIGRPSKWGNPFSHKPGTLARFQVETRWDAVKQYENYVMTRPDLLAALPELKGKILVCWCKPSACHGDVLKRMAESL